MIGQYLSNTNERATVSILQNILELNKGPSECENVALTQEGYMGRDFICLHPPNISGKHKQ
jgi:hypothetical protein